ncbi:sensor histidine kinase KdpD [Herbaspirillum sp. SJZ107]|uniref:sensor histidine kinase n=1 Tax=Herbaspirillum sp. SJZ107 TaxID=2572881 RepID=UPI001153DDD2|nr:HAMP domain-containing sensor histidine kinase [Herbaspirillum sp. SJZ107]TQK01269.1 phospho-acceptor domain-containing protein [Herbaspirillum sp. SJZ107]
MSAPHTLRFEQLAATKDAVLAAWLDQVRSEIPYAASVPLPSLVNTMPLFFEHLVETTVGEAAAFDHATLASEHGGQRARVTRFNAGSIVHEFQLFRSAVLATWHGAGIALELDEVERLNKAIDVALRASLTGFSDSQVQIREQFFSALTHDMRTPLAAASVAVNVIHATSDPERVRRMAEVAMRQHARLETMMCDLLDMMVLEAGTTMIELASTELYELAGDAVASVALTSGREIVLGGQRIPGRWHAAALRRAIENLLINAVKYSDKDTSIEILVLARDGSATVAVTNTGPVLSHC